MHANDLVPQPKKMMYQTKRIFYVFTFLNLIKQQNNHSKKQNYKIVLGLEKR